MPILRYFVFVGLALVGLIFAYDAVTLSSPSARAPVNTAAAAISHSSIDLLRAMSHHGEVKSTDLANAGPLLPVTVPSHGTTGAGAAEAEAAITPVAAKPSSLDAQAQIHPDELVKPKPAKKRIAVRKPVRQNRYVENTQRDAFDLFGPIQSW